MVAKRASKCETGNQIVNVDAPLPTDCIFFEIMLYTDDEPNPLMPKSGAQSCDFEQLMKRIDRSM